MTFLTSGSCSYIPRTHWLYDGLAMLSAHGLIPGYPARLFDDDRMFTREEIAQMLVKSLRSIAEGKKASLADLFVLGKLVEEFLADLENVGVDIKRVKREIAGWEVPEGLYAISGGLKGSNIEDSAKSYAESIVNLFTDLNPRSSLYLKVNNLWGKSIADKHRFDRLLFTWKEPKFTVELGRDPMWWGPGFNGTLTLSNNHPSLDFIRANYQLGKVKFTGFNSSLDLSEKRFLLGHRVEFSPNPDITIGLSDTVIVPGRIPEPYYLVSSYLPIPFYPLELAIDKDDNVQIGLDAHVYVKEGVQFYGEFLVDDLIVKPLEQLTAHKLGYLLGIYFHDPKRSWKTNLRVEFAHLDKGVYLNPYKPNWYWYYHEDHCIGHWLGDNEAYRGEGSQDFRVEINCPILEETYLRALYSIEDYGLLPGEVKERRNVWELRVIHDWTSNLFAGLTYRKIYRLESSKPTNQKETDKALIIELGYYF